MLLIINCKFSPVIVEQMYETWHHSIYFSGHICSRNTFIIIIIIINIVVYIIHCLLRL
jgi:hypothetical protein